MNSSTSGSQSNGSPTSRPLTRTQFSQSPITFPPKLQKLCSTSPQVPNPNRSRFAQPIHSSIPTLCAASVSWAISTNLPALDYPWEKWTIFLHPAQRQLVERDFQGPARVSGTAGTGKTVVALHRAVYVAKSECPRAAHHVYQCTRQRAPIQTQTPHQQRAQPRRADRGPLARRSRRTVVPCAFRPAQSGF